MKISWFFGFGWLSILTVVACGIAINTLSGQIVWILYVPFLMTALHMTKRFKLFNNELWRRVHSKAMIAYGELAEQEYEAAKKENREYDIQVPCRGLAEQLFGQRQIDVSGLLTEEGRKTYYKELVASHPHIFLEGIDPDRHTAVIDGVLKDVDASQAGPDILIAKEIELKHNRGEAARYLQALMLGKVR